MERKERKGPTGLLVHELSRICTNGSASTAGNLQEAAEEAEKEGTGKTLKSKRWGQEDEELISLHLFDSMFLTEFDSRFH